MTVTAEDLRAGNLSQRHCKKNLIVAVHTRLTMYSPPLFAFGMFFVPRRARATLETAVLHL